MSHRKVIKTERRPVQYRPADAVRDRGDYWRYGDEIWNISSSTFEALSSGTQNDMEAAIMRLCERGQLDRIESI